MLESPPAEIAYAGLTAIANMSEGCATTCKLGPLPSVTLIESDTHRPQRHALLDIASTRFKNLAVV